MARLLVTGGAGFIGANFVHYWIREHSQDRVVALDALTYAGNRTSLAEAEGHVGFRFVRGDIRDQELVEALLLTEQLDTIVHFAAESHVDRSISDPDIFVEVNVGGTQSLLAAARAVWLEGEGKSLPHRFHHVSTDEVYGSLRADDPPSSEEGAYSPSSPYAASKAAADHLVGSYHGTYGLETTISKCTNNYGPFQLPEKLVPLSIVNLLDGRDLPIYGDGSNMRDWLYVEDHCRGIERALIGGQAGRTYNLGTGSEHTNLQIVHMLCRLVDQHFAADTFLGQRFPTAPPAKGEVSASSISFVEDRPGHDLRYALDTTRATSELGFSPKVSLEAGLDQTLRWYLDNEVWWRRTMDETYRNWIRQQYGGR